MAIIKVKNLSFRAGKDTIVDNVSLELRKGELVFLQGPSGSGKSTVLKLIADLLPPSEGELFYKGQNYQSLEPVELRKQVTYCFQDAYLFGERVIDNLAFPYQIRKQKPDLQKMRHALREFGLAEELLEQNVSTLSGGEKQRIALIRSLLFDPEVLLLDEITSALDPESTALTESIIAERCRKGCSALWISHDPEQAERLGERILQMKAGRLAGEEEVL